jgi:uncharacterized membrane protein YcaP (DUF421 family)
MELSHILIRAVSAYIILLALMRISGKRTIFQTSVFDLVITLILGDMIDDFIWAEVGGAQFVAGVSSIFITHALLSWLRLVSGEVLTVKRT